MAASENIESLNQEFYHSQAVAQWFATKAFVLPEEQTFLRDFAGDIRGKSVFDVGIGAGRTIRFLQPLAAHYTGIDFSPEMVQEARDRFPEVRLEVRDVMDLSAYADGEFECVIFSFNGIDSLSHEGRLRAMREIHRVLKAGGVFAFSSHNRDRPRVSPYALENLSLSKHPVRMLKNFRHYCSCIRNWKRSLHCAVDEDEYALRHDSGNFFKVPIYYISKREQVRQVARLGFLMEAVYDGKGRKTEADATDPVSSWIFYVCRKAA